MICDPAEQSPAEIAAAIGASRASLTTNMRLLIASGLVQLIVAVVRRKMGGQWPMILSGGISVLAGGSFIAGASAPDPSLTNVAGYAVLGGIFFLVSAIRLGRAAANA